MVANAAPGHVGGDVEHVDDLVLLERREADHLALVGRHQGQRLCQPRGEGLGIIRRGGPRLLLADVVVLAGELLDRVAEDLRAGLRVPGEVRAQRDGGAGGS